MEYPYPIQTLDDELQVWELWAWYDYQIEQLAGSRWRFVTLRDVGITQADLADLWRDTLEPYYVMNRPGDWTLHHLSVRDYWPGTRADYEYVYPEFYGPDSDDYGTPPQVSPVLPWTSGHPGRSYRGRTYWGPVRREHADEGFLDVDGRDAPIAYGNAITNHFAGTLPFAAPEFAIVSEYHDGEPTYPPKFVLPAFFGVDAFLRTQRRRQPNTRLVLG